MNKAFLILYTSLTILFFISCGGKITPPINPTVNQPLAVNVYIENSGSMDGYVKGATEFEQAVYNYLTDIKISRITDSLNLFYINSEIIPQGSDIKDFIEKLEPATFKKKGGNTGTTDISNLLKTVLNETKSDDVAILVTDGIFSPGRGCKRRRIPYQSTDRD